jgi:hypothetical protein
LFLVSFILRGSANTALHTNFGWTLRLWCLPWVSWRT